MSPVKARPRTPAEPATRPRREDDFYGWLHEQAALLDAGRVDEIDAAWIAEELLDVGKSEYRELRSAVVVVIIHMLKWDHQAERRSRSWLLSIDVHRDRIAETLRDSPSLRPKLAEIMESAYREARKTAAMQTKLPLEVFPRTCPYAFDAITDRVFVLGDDRTP